MDFFSNSADISALSSMLDESRLATENGPQQSQQPPMKLEQTRVVLGGSGITSIPNNNNSSNSNNNKDVPKKTSKNDIWQDDEIPSEDSIMSKNDDRPSPKYEFSYKQEIGTQDTFLNLNGKTPSSSDCSHLVIKIYFPGSQMKDLDLDVTRNRIKAESKILKLFTYLPVSVKHNNGKASFDNKTEVLTVTLPLINELFE